jgi:acetylornithine deacetylase/succinyl-diaminopimelate desuccinylase-like protein
VPLTRDVVFCAVPDEEGAGTLGMQWLCRHRPDVVDVEFAINEGGSGVIGFAGSEAPLFLVGTDEKELCWLRLTAEGATGHGSLPHADNSAVRLMRALLRLADWERDLTFTPQTRALVAQIAAAGLLPPERQPAALESALRSDPSAHAMFVNTLNVTMVDAGIKANVIPARSEAVLDCRLLPGESSDSWIALVRERVADEGVVIERYFPKQQPPPETMWDTELYRLMRDVLTEAVEGAVVAPALAPLATDNRHLRELGIPSYGLIPCLLSVEERAGFHAHNEFLTVDNLQMGCELMYEIVRRACT